MGLIQKDAFRTMLLSYVGMKKEILRELENELSKEDMQKVQSLFKQMKDKQQEINNAIKRGAAEDEIKKLQTE